MQVVGEGSGTKRNNFVDCATFVWKFRIAHFCVTDLVFLKYTRNVILSQKNAEQFQEMPRESP